MQKLAVSTFSAHDKDALLDEYKIIVEAGELRSTSDVRWDSAIDRLRVKYGLHLDDWKRIGPDQRGQKCDEGRGWIGLKGSCKRSKKSMSSDDKAKLKKESARGLADKIRAKKGMRDRNNPKVEAEKPAPTKKASELKTGDKIRFGTGFRGVPEGDYVVIKRGQYLSNDYVDVKKLSPTGKQIGKVRSLLIPMLETHAGKGIEVNPKSLDKSKSSQPIEDLSRSRKGPSISQRNVVATDKRFNTTAVNNALDQIQSEGAAERLASVRSVIESQGIQAVFKGRASSGSNEKLAQGVEAKGPAYKSMSDAIDKYEADGFTSIIPSLKKRRNEAIVGGRSKALGYTRVDSRHVVISTEKRGKYSAFEVTPKEMQDVADAALSPKNGRRAFSLSVTTTGAASDLVTYLHEVGHQMQWISESKDPALSKKAPMTKGVTSYGNTNKAELFAEGFALWVLDAKGLKSKNPEMHDYIQESVSAAMSANRRIDALDAGISPQIRFTAPEIAQTALGQKAFEITLSGDLSLSAYNSLDRLAILAKSTQEQDEVYAAIEAFLVSGGEFLDPVLRSDSLHLDSTEVTRYTQAIDRLNQKHGWHLDTTETLIRLDAWKRIGPSQMGQKCGRGWVGLRGACKRVPKGGDRNAAIRESKQALTARIRKKKGLSTIEDRDGKKDPVSYAFVPGKNKSSTMQARRTTPKSKGWQPPDRASRMMAQEENRARVNWGKTTGDWKQKPDSTAAMDMVKPKPRTKKSAKIKSEVSQAIEMTPLDRLAAKIEKRNLRLSGGVIAKNAEEASKLKRIYRIRVGLETSDRATDVAEWKAKQKKRQSHVAKIEKKKAEKKAKKELDRRQSEAVARSEKERRIKVPIVVASEVISDVDKRAAVRRRLEEFAARGPLSGGEVARIAKVTGLSKADQKALSMKLSKSGMLSRATSTKREERAFSEALLSGRSRIAGARMEAIQAAGARIGWASDRSIEAYKKLSRQEAVDRRKRLADAEVLAEATPIASAKPLKDLFAEADRIGAKYKGPSTMTERRVARQEADRIMQESGATEVVDRASGVSSVEKARRQRETIANAPVRLSNERTSKQPRRRGRSVD